MAEVPSLLQLAKELRLQVGQGSSVAVAAAFKYLCCS
jgi:hypothetical protein